VLVRAGTAFEFNPKHSPIPPRDESDWTGKIH
jgi:hypothetical protein